MKNTFYFYDLETSGLNARDDRIMQFAGIRTDEYLQPISEPHNVLVTLTDDILPSPYAIMVTGITPQKTISEGISERDFCKFLMDEVFVPGTTTVGFNNVRFDDEFIRHTLWRNFYDPYEWAWSEGRSRWDLLDVVRLTRALRPEGIKWPVDSEGKPVNKLELLTRENDLVHSKAHDALSDVEALISVASLIKQQQPKLFDYLLTLRSKREVANLVNLENPKPFVYASGRYDPAHEKATVAFPIAPGVKPGSVLVYDLRVNPQQFVNATPKQLFAVLSADKQARSDADFIPLPVKELSYNKCPAVAPLGVLDEAAQKRIGVSIDLVSEHMKVLQANLGFGGAIREAYEMREPYAAQDDVEHKLYDGFIAEKDKPRMVTVRQADENELSDFHPTFVDERFNELLFRYKARQFPTSLSEEEYERWERYRHDKIMQQLPSYMEVLQKLALTESDTYLLEELQLWAETVYPETI